MSFAAALLGSSGATRSNCKPSKPYGFRYNTVIILENPNLNPYSRINGHFEVDLAWPVSHSGLRIQLEAYCTLKFQTKVDGRISFHKKFENLLAGAERLERTGAYAYIASPIYTDLIPEKGWDEEQYEMPAGCNRYRFSLQTTGETLPAPFKNNYGFLIYKVVAYILQNSQWVEIADKEMQFSGYHNLSQNIEALKPIQIERAIKKSIFSSKRILTATLELEGCGYLPNEEIPFTFRISNPKIYFPVGIWVKLIQRIVYNIDGAKKVTVAALDATMNELNTPRTETVWSGAIKVHKAASPSYTAHDALKVSHEFQFKIKLEDYGTVKGEVPIYIGTTREPAELLMASGNSLKVWNSRLPLRRSSASSIYSNFSSSSTFTLPPAYSQLSSRVPSLETLPPPYAFDEDGDDAIAQSLRKGQEEFNCLEFREDHSTKKDDLSGESTPQSISNKTPATTPVQTGPGEAEITQRVGVLPTIAISPEAVADNDDAK